MTEEAPVIVGFVHYGLALWVETCNGDLDALVFEMVSLRKLGSIYTAIHCIVTMIAPVLWATPPTKIGLDGRVRSCSTPPGLGRCADVFPRDGGMGGRRRRREQGGWILPNGAAMIDAERYDLCGHQIPPSSSPAPSHWVSVAVDAPMPLFCSGIT